MLTLTTADWASLVIELAILCRVTIFEIGRREKEYEKSSEHKSWLFNPKHFTLILSGFIYIQYLNLK